MIGTTEIIVIGGVVLLLFGGKKIPDLMRSMGKGVKNFKEGMAGKDEPETPAQEKKANNTEEEQPNKDVEDNGR